MPVTYTDENVRFDGSPTPALVLKTDAGIRTLIEEQALTTYDKAQWDLLWDTYSGTFPSTATSGYQFANFGGTVVGGNPSGLTGDNAAGYQVANFGGLVVGGNASGLVQSVAEVTDLDFTAHTIVAADYFTLNAPAGSFYVWYTVDAVGVDPAPGGTGISVAILSTDTPAQVATKTAAAIDGDANFSAPVPGANIATVTNASTGSVADAVDVNAGVGVAVQTQGVDAVTYTATITVDGSNVMPISFTGDVAQTFTAVIGQITSDLAAGTVGAATIDGGNIKITSNTSNASSSVSIVDGTLFAALNDFVSFDTAVAGSGGAAQLTATITVDGTPIAIDIDGDLAQTFTNLVSQINIDLGVAATMTIDGGNLKVTSASTGQSSTVSMTDGGLFAALNGFVKFDSSVQGLGVMATIMDAAMYELLPNGKTYYETYRGMFKELGSKPEGQGGGPFNMETAIYHNGTGWVHMHDDSAA